MSREKLHRTVQELIAAGKTKDVFSFLHQQDLSSDETKSLALIEESYQDLQKSKLKGIISYQEERLQKNKINDQLLSLFPETRIASIQTHSSLNLSKLLAGFLLLAIAGGMVWWFGKVQHTCPSFSKSTRNKILTMPFTNVTGGTAKPQVVIRDRITQLTAKNNLSTEAALGTSMDVTMRNASLIAQNCKANVVIWGTYSDTDSLRLHLNYHFSKDPPEHKIGELIEVKEVIDVLKKGQILKSQEDAILSLCGIIAMREGKEEVAKKWFDKLTEKEQMDRELLDALE